MAFHTDDLVKAETVDQCKAGLAIGFVIRAAHQVQYRLRLAGVEQGEGVNHCFNVLDCSKTDKGADVQNLAGGRRCNGLEFFAADTVGDDRTLFLRAADADLALGCAVKQGSNFGGMTVSTAGHVVEQLRPQGQHAVHGPISRKQLFFAFAGIDAVLGKDHGLAGGMGSQRSQQTAVARYSTVINVGLRDRRGQHAGNGLEHGTQAVECIGQTQSGGLIGDGPGKLQEYRGGGYSLGVPLQGGNQLHEAFPTVALLLKNHFNSLDGLGDQLGVFLGRTLAAALVQVYPVMRHNVVWQGVEHLAGVSLGGMDGPEHKLNVGAAGHILMCPGGYAAANIGIAAFKNQTDLHFAASHLICTSASVTSST